MMTLIRHGADPFIQSNLNANIIHAAVESNALQSLAYALEISKRYPYRLDIDQPNTWGESPLIMASQGCLVDCVQLLIGAGADRGIRQENQQVALHYAGLSERSPARRETVALLCGEEEQSRSHINTQDEDGRTPILDFLDDSECIKLLICRGARLDLLDQSGKSVFHHICIQGGNEQLKTLLQPCTVITAAVLRGKDNDGNTAFIEALRNGNVGCAMTLLKLKGHWRHRWPGWMGSSPLCNETGRSRPFGESIETSELQERNENGRRQDRAGRSNGIGYLVRASKGAAEAI